MCLQYWGHCFLHFLTFEYNAYLIINKTVIILTSVFNINTFLDIITIDKP